jgi:hypothetical protein
MGRLDESLICRFDKRTHKHSRILPIGKMARTDRVGANHFRVADRWLRAGSRKRILKDIRLRSAGRHEHERNDGEVFHGSNRGVDLVDSGDGGTGTADWGDPACAAKRSGAAGRHIQPWQSWIYMKYSIDNRECRFVLLHGAVKATNRQSKQCWADKSWPPTM